MTTVPNQACRQTLENISAYLDGDLDAATCERIERHSRDCPGCAAALDGLRRTTGLCRQAGRVELPAEVRDRARAAIRQLLASDPALPGVVDDE